MDNEIKQVKLIQTKCCTKALCQDGSVVFICPHCDRIVLDYDLWPMRERLVSPKPPILDSVFKCRECKGLLMSEG